MENTLILVDAMSYLYRAYHAMPGLSNPAGEPTGAIYGVLQMLRRLDADYASQWGACVFDGKGKTFRHTIYPDYKGTRPPMPDDLIAQIEPLLSCIRALGWPVIISDGVEADDVIGALAKKAADSGMACKISTGDKDMAQLVNDKVTLVNTMNQEVLDETAVKAKFGVYPHQIIDYLTLIGDNVDNVPGVPKVGPKTAAKWLEKYGSLDILIAHASEIKGAVGESFRNSLDWLPTGKSLITIKTDVENLPALDSLTRKPIDTEAIRALFERLAFKSWLRELGKNTFTAASPVPVHAMPAAPINQPDIPKAQQEGALEEAALNLKVETVLTEEQLKKWVEKIKTAPQTAVDTETTGLDALNAELVGISLSVSNQEGAYIPLAHKAVNAPQQLDRDMVLNMLKPWLSDETAAKTGQNIKYDMHVFENYGIRLKGIKNDTMIEGYLLASHLPVNMDALAARYLHRETITYEQVCGKGAKQIPFADTNFPLACKYAAEDAEVTFALNDTLLPKLNGESSLLDVYRTIEMPMVPVLQRMERAGVLIDVFYLDQQSQALAEKMAALQAEAYQAAGREFNVNSTKQLREILFDEMKLTSTKKTPGGVLSVDEDVLEKLAEDHPLPRILLDYRTLAKLKSTYVDKLPLMVNPKTGRVHTTYAQTVVVTGRLASSDPNLQNIPIRTEEGRQIRRAFIAPAGHKLIAADYSQIELRIMAHLSQDPNLLAAFEAGKDIHRATAAEIFGASVDEVTKDQRRMAKAINFGLIYGMSAFGLAKQIGITRQSAALYMERYFAKYPNVKQYMETTRQYAKTHGYVETLFGRRVWAPDIHSKIGARRQGAERAAINAPMQGTAADLIKLAMIKVDEWLKQNQLKTRMILQVHDELVFESPDDEVQTVCNALPNLLGGVANLSVPLLANIGVGENWDDAH